MLRQLHVFNNYSLNFNLNPVEGCHGRALHTCMLSLLAHPFSRHVGENAVCHNVESMEATISGIKGLKPPSLAM